jgi:uncharacterized protein
MPALAHSWLAAGAMTAATASSWLLAGGCASVPASEDAAPSADAAPLADAGRPIGGRDGGHPDAAASDGGPTGADAGPILAPLFNEFVADHVGTDLCEFVEILGQPSTDYGAFSVLVVEGDAGAANPGSVDRSIAVGTTDQVGLWQSGPLNSAIENGTTTLLLVSGFRGGAFDLDSDDDGTVDQEPWGELVDAVAVTDSGASDRHYAGGALLEAGFDGGAFPVGGASRIPDGGDTDLPADWVRNDFDGLGLDCGAGSPQLGEALNTPGVANAVQR